MEFTCSDGRKNRSVLFPSRPVPCSSFLPNQENYIKAHLEGKPFQITARTSYYSVDQFGSDSRDDNTVERQAVMLILPPYLDLVFFSFIRLFQNAFVLQT